MWQLAVGWELELALELASVQALELASVQALELASVQALESELW